MHFPSCYKNADSLWMSPSPKSALRHKESSFAQSYALFPGDSPYPVIAKYGGAKAHPPVSIGNSSDGSPSPRSPVRTSKKASAASTSELNFSLCPILLSSVSSRCYSWEYSPPKLPAQNLTSMSLFQEAQSKRAGSQCQSS